MASIIEDLPSPLRPKIAFKPVSKSNVVKLFPYDNKFLKVIVLNSMNKCLYHS